MCFYGMIIRKALLVFIVPHEIVAFNQPLYLLLDHPWLRLEGVDLLDNLADEFVMLFVLASLHDFDHGGLDERIAELVELLSLIGQVLVMFLYRFL